MLAIPKLNLDLQSVPGLDRLIDKARHWREQALQCLPRAVRLWVARRRPVLVVAADGDDAELLQELLGEREPVGALDLRTSGLASPVAAGPRRRWTARVLELPAAAVLTRSVQLPLQVRDHLHRVIGFEIDRLTPFQAPDVYYDARIRGSVAQGSKLDVELAVCRRDRAADWLERLREAGIPATHLRWQGAWRGANLLPPSERPRTSYLGAVLTGLLVAGILLLLGAVLISPIWQKQQEHEALERELRSVRVAAEQVGTVREELERARLGSVEVLTRKREQPRMTDLLRKLTDRLPDNTWVQTLNVRDGDVDIRGESGQATALIGLLEQADGISQVSFRSPVMQVAQTGNERFHITFNYARPEEP